MHQEEVDPYPIKYVCTVETENRFLPTSLASSILNFVLELYIIIRSLTLMQPPRMKLTIVQNARIVQAGSLLLFDLLVVIPNTTSTNLLAEFIPFSIGALGVLGQQLPMHALLMNGWLTLYTKLLSMAPLITRISL